MNKLTDNDLRFVAQRLPKDVRGILSKHAEKVFVGGGFIRATIAGEEVSDIDIFADTKERLELIAKDLHESRPGSKLHRTANAITLITPDRLPVQFITRWLFPDAASCVASFDFTVCQAVIWREGYQSNALWASSIGENFYIDLAGRRLVYTNPVREEEAGGSMLRVIKYVRRGYTIQPTSLGDVMARVFAGIDPSRTCGRGTGVIVAGLLRDVDPLLVIDVFDVVDDHETAEGEKE